MYKLIGDTIDDGRSTGAFYISVKKKKEDRRNCTRMRERDEEKLIHFGIDCGPLRSTLCRLFASSRRYLTKRIEPRFCFDLDGNIISVRERWRYFSSVQSHYYYDISAGYTLST